MIHPNALFFCSNSNEDKTENDILQLGLNLAKEIQ